MYFKDIFGHQSVKQHLISSVKNNRVSHAQLFLGPEGSGSLALAIAYAQYINCENKLENDSCGLCNSCRKYDRLIHPDLHFSYPFYPSKDISLSTHVIEQWRKTINNNPYLSLEHWRNNLDVGNKQANIPIKEAHDIIKKLSLKSFEAEYKILIMWLPEYLDSQGNALLKLIEEPPPKTLFLFVAENQDKILNTIISRTQLIKINKLNSNEIINYLTIEKSIAKNIATEIALIADGNIQEALNLLNRDSTGDNFSLLVKWLRHIVTNNGIELITFSEDVLSKQGRENQKSFLLFSLNMMRQVILMQQGLNNLIFLPKEESSFIEKISNLFNLQQLHVAIMILEKAYFGIERNGNPKILFLDLSLQLTLLFKFQTFPKGTQYI